VLLIQRLLREQHKRGGAHVSPDVLAADLALKPTLIRAILARLEAAGVIERHHDHRLDSDELRVYSVPLADSYYPIDTAAIDPDETRQLEPIEVG
jgi:hypothetical protein